MLLTDQEVFDKVARHLLTQGCKSISGGNCAYRGEGRTKCAIGCLIEDNLYDPDFEGVAVNSFTPKEEHFLYKRVLALRSVLTGNVTNNLTLLSSLQRVHDQTPTCDWKYGLRNVANQLSLNSSVLDEFPDPQYSPLALLLPIVNPCDYGIPLPEIPLQETLTGSVYQSQAL